MKHLLMVSAMACLASTQALSNGGNIPESPLVLLPDKMVQPANPMEGYSMTPVTESKMMTMWNNMNDSMDGKDCYRRAQIWTFDMADLYRVKSAKVFIHYTNKFNRQIDGVAKMNKRGLKGVIDGRIYKMLGYNKTWDYHVAPLVKLTNGEYQVLDKELILAYDAQYPYSPNEAWNLTKRPASIDEWLEGLTVRGELLWKARKAMIERDMRRAGGAQYDRLQTQYKSFGMDKHDSIDIKCHKANSIAEVDLNHKTAYCFYTIAPMYYYNELDLRSLAFGYTNQNYSSPVRLDTYTEENFESGKTNYVQNKWNYSELKDAKKEFKWRAGSSYSERIKKYKY